MLSEPPIGAVVTRPAVLPPVAETEPPMNTLPLTAPLIERAVVLSPVMAIVPFCARSPCNGPSRAMPKELLPWTVTEEPTAKVMSPTRGDDPVRWTP